MIRTGRPNVILADPDSARRQMLARSAVATGLIEAATLQEAYLLAEELGPDMLVLAVDFLLEPELEGLLRLARMLGCRVLVYSPAGWPNVGRAVLDRVVCVPLGQGDRLDDLIARRGRGTPVDDPDQAQASVPELILIGASTGGNRRSGTRAGNLPGRLSAHPDRPAYPRRVCAGFGPAAGHALPPARGRSLPIRCRYNAEPSILQQMRIVT